MPPEPPPELMQMLGQEQPQGVPGIEDPEYLEIVGLLEDILKREPDPEDSAKLAKLVADLYGLAAGRVKEADDALGGKVSPRFLRRNG